MRAKKDLSKKRWLVLLLRGHGLGDLFGTSCMTISCAWNYLLKWASSASRTTHLSSVPLKTSESLSWGSIKVCGGQSVGWIAEVLKWPLKRPRGSFSKTWGWVVNKHEVPGGAVGSNLNLCLCYVGRGKGDRWSGSGCRTHSWNNGLSDAPVCADLNARRVILHTSDENDRARWASTARQ